MIRHNTERHAVIILTATQKGFNMITENVLKQFVMCNFVLRANVGEITQEESLLQPKPAGNCVNWVLGHIIVYRCRLLRGLGAEAVWDEADYKLYERHEAPLTRPEGAKPIAELWSALDETLKRLEMALSTLTPAKLAEVAPFIQDDEPGGTFETALTVFAFHDAYHSGQTGVLRRIIGKPPADL